jgi:Spy/CpxP family protein refolding chaperone
MKRTLYGLLLALAVAIPIVALAESAKGDHDREHGSRGRLFLVLRMADELDLSDEKALAVSRALKGAEDRREELRGKRRELEKQIRAALDQKKPDDAALTKLIDQAVELDRQQAKAMEDSFTSLKKILSVEEQAKLVLLRGRMHHEMGFRGHGGGGRWHHGRGGEGFGPPRGPDDDRGGPGDEGPPPPPPEEG